MRIFGAGDYAMRIWVKPDRLATLGAEALNVARADDALAAISRVIRDTLQLAECRIHVAPTGEADNELRDPLVAWAVRSGQAVLRHADGTTGLAPGGMPFELSLEGEIDARQRFHRHSQLQPRRVPS